MEMDLCFCILLILGNYQQESCRAYGTAGRGLVIHVNEIHLTLTLKVLNPNPKCLTLTLQVLNPNPKSVTCLVGGMLKMTHPNPKSCSKMPKSKFSFWV